MIEFSVFLPVRNGWPHIEQCVRSILAQSYQHFDLNVLDNQSTDGTLEWLRTIDDPRLRLLTSPVPLGIEDSWGRILGRSKREFMTVIGHDDLFEPEFLDTARNLIEGHPGAGLYQIGARYINESGALLRECRQVPEREMAADYLRARLCSHRDVYGTGYVMRSSDYDRLGGIGKFERLFFADDVLWMSLIQGSYKAADPRIQCAIRIHPKSESASVPSVWPSLLRGLNQFVEYLRHSSEGNPELGSVICKYMPGFLLRYHRNIYIYALIEASQRRERISGAALDSIRTSLRKSAPYLRATLRGSITVRVIELFNAIHLQRQLVALWAMYSELKCRPR